MRTTLSTQIFLPVDSVVLLVIVMEGGGWGGWAWSVWQLYHRALSHAQAEGQSPSNCSAPFPICLNRCGVCVGEWRGKKKKKISCRWKGIWLPVILSHLHPRAISALRHDRRAQVRSRCSRLSAGNTGGSCTNYVFILDTYSRDGLRENARVSVHDLFAAGVEFKTWGANNSTV